LISRLAQVGGVPVLDPLPRRPLVVLDTLGFYLVKLFVPTNLAIDYGRIPAKVSFGLPMVFAGVFLLFFAAAMAMPSFPRRRWFLAGMLVFVAGMLPVLGFVKFYFQFYSTVADRYLYLSMFGPAIVVTGLLRRQPGESARGGRARFLNVRVIGSLAVLAALAVLSWIQAGVWTSDARLFQQALAVNPSSIAANQTLGFLAAQDAQQNTDSPVRKNQLLALALRYDNAAIAVNYDNPRAHFNRGNLLLRMGHPDQSLTDYASAAGRFDDEAELQNNWGVACLQMNQNQEALKHFYHATELDAHFADAFANAGTAFLHLGDLAQARNQFAQALALNPNQPQALSGMGKMQSMLPAK
jgi:tetratricopeptide (TPR) repeat protein